MSDDTRIVTPEIRGDEIDSTMRPQVLDDFVGQAQARANLKVFIGAAKARGEALDHVLRGNIASGLTVLLQRFTCLAASEAATWS